MDKSLTSSPFPSASCVTPQQTANAGSSSSSSSVSATTKFSFQNHSLFSPVTPAIPNPSCPPLSPDKLITIYALKTFATATRPTELNLLTSIRFFNPDFVSKRSILLDWMQDLCTKYGAKVSTFHLCMRFVDCFMGGATVEQSCWQLIAIVAFLIAAKCEESGESVPLISELSFLCANAFSKKNIEEMETSFLNFLNWSLVVKTPAHFLEACLLTVRGRVEAAEVNDLMNTQQAAPSQAGLNDGFLLTNQDDDNDTDYMIDCLCEGECACKEDGDDDDGFMGAHGDENIVYTIDDLERCAYVYVDLTMYDLQYCAKFTPHVISAACLAVATEVTGESVLRKMDVCVVTNVADADFGACYNMLKAHIEREKAIYMQD